MLLLTVGGKPHHLIVRELAEEVAGIASGLTVCYTDSGPKAPDDGSRTRIAKTAHRCAACARKGVCMDWLVLVASGAMEAVWALALDRAEGFTRPLPTIIFLAALAVSMLGLSHAVKSIPIGTAYAVWVGIGAAVTVGYSMITGAEAASPAKIALLVGLVACVVGLKLVGDAH